MATTSETLIACERCSLSTPADISRCPKLGSQDCHFNMAQGRCDGWHELSVAGTPPMLTWMGALLVTAFAVAFCASVSNASLVAVECFGLMALGMCLSLLSHLLRHKTLWNRATGATWQRLSLLGIPIQTSWFTAAFSRGVETPAAKLPDLPFSIASLAADSSGKVAAAQQLEDAITVAQFALAGLALHGSVRVAQGTYRSSTLGGLSKIHKANWILLFPRKQVSSGEVEKALVSAISKSYRPLTIFQATRAFFERDQDFPAKWLIEIALADSVATGIFRETVGSKPNLLFGPQRYKHYRVEESLLDSFMRDKQLANDACAALYASIPGWQNETRTQIKAAIASRVTKDSY